MGKMYQTLDIAYQLHSYRYFHPRNNYQYIPIKYIQQADLD